MANVNLSRKYFEKKADEYSNATYELTNIKKYECVDFKFSEEEKKAIQDVINILNNKVDAIENFLEDKNNTFSAY